MFLDDEARLLDDPEHSTVEDRFILLGLSHALRVLIVVHCYRASVAEIRIISARRATCAESRQYAVRGVQCVRNMISRKRGGTRMRKR